MPQSSLPVEIFAILCEVTDIIDIDAEFILRLCAERPFVNVSEKLLLSVLSDFVLINADSDFQ